VAGPGGFAVSEMIGVTAMAGTRARSVRDAVFTALSNFKNDGTQFTG
jgi:hypothetical protein